MAARDLTEVLTMYGFYYDAATEEYVNSFNPTQRIPKSEVDDDAFAEPAADTLWHTPPMCSNWNAGSTTTIDSMPVKQAPNGANGLFGRNSTLIPAEADQTTQVRLDFEWLGSVGGISPQVGFTFRFRYRESNPTADGTTRGSYTSVDTTILIPDGYTANDIVRTTFLVTLSAGAITQGRMLDIQLQRMGVTDAYTGTVYGSVVRIWTPAA